MAPPLRELGSPLFMNLVVKNGTVVTRDATFAADIVITDGTITAVTSPGSADRLSGADEYDAAGKYVLPGVIDGHVHFREPGLEYKEDFKSGSTAAVMGGVTTVIDMPNTKPPTVNAETVRQKMRLAEAGSYCDVGVIGAFIQENLGDLQPMAEAGVLGYKCFLGQTVGNIPAPDDGMLLDGLAKVAETRLRIGFHAENDQIMQHLIRKAQSAGRTDPPAHLDTRPALAEVESIQRVALFASYARTKIHIFHVSSLDGLNMIDHWRARGVDITCETGAHYCFLSSEDTATLGAIVRINPPVRGGDHGPALVRALAEGRINSIATDHSPHTKEEKLNEDIWKAVSGFAGVETSVRLFLTYGVNTSRLTLNQYAYVTSEGPAKAWNLYPKKGAIQVGSDGDLTIVDLRKTGTIRESGLHGKNNLNPFEGHQTTGAPVATILRGQLIMRDGELVGGPSGKVVLPLP